MNIYEIAKKSGVSRATVSRVINNFPGVRDETRQRVQRVIEESNYIPSAAARSLASQKSNIIGSLMYNITQPFWGQVISGIEDGVSQSDYGLFFVNSKSHITAWDYQKTYKHNLRNLIRRGVDGIIIALVNDIDVEDVDFLETAQTPYIVLQNGLDDPRIASVNVDNVAGGRDATNYLIGLGHRLIFHVTGPILSSTGRDRLKGFMEAMEQAGLTVPPYGIVNGGHAFSDGYWGMKQILSGPHIPTGIFFSCDEAAYGGILAAREESVRIPEDISVIGYDGIAVQLEHMGLLPKLTTMCQPVHEIGNIGSKMLLRCLEGERPEPSTVVLQTSLLEGDTCRPISGRN